MADVDRILDDRGPTVEAIWEMGPRLQRLVAEGGDLTKQGEASVGSTGLPSRILHVDPQGRYKFVLASFPPGEPTPIHSHHRWGLECGVAGRERFTVWRRVSDDESGQAILYRLSRTITSSGETWVTGMTRRGTYTGNGPRETSRPPWR